MTSQIPTNVDILLWWTLLWEFPETIFNLMLTCNSRMGPLLAVKWQIPVQSCLNIYLITFSSSQNVERCDRGLLNYHTIFYQGSRALLGAFLLNR